MALDHVRPRGDTAADWTTANPVLLNQEMGLELDTRRWKVGDGVTPWAGLPYFDEDGTAASTVTRDAFGRIAAYTTGGVTTTITRGPTGRIVSYTTGSVAHTVTRDASGRIVSVT